MIAGEKDSGDSFLRRGNVDIKPETMFFKLNPTLHSLFDAVVINDFDKGEIARGQFSVDRLGLMFNNLEYAKDFASWALTYDAFDHFTHADDETDPGAGALKFFLLLWKKQNCVCFQSLHRFLSTESSRLQLNMC